MPGGDRQQPRVPLNLAGEIFRTWRGMQGRVFIEGTLGWAGRISEIVIGDLDVEGGCSVTLGWQGHVYDLEREQPELDADYADEFATVSASELIQLLVGQSASPIAKRYVNVAATAVGIGPVGTSMQDTILSLILNQLKGASSAGVEYSFLIWDPADGPHLIPIGVGPTKYRLRLRDAPGTSVRWSLDEYVSDVKAIFTNADGVSDASDVLNSVDGPLLHNGLRAYRSISVDAVAVDGATAARDAFAALHEDPVGVTGMFIADDFISNVEGAPELAGLVRAGEIAVVPDALPLDPRLTVTGRTWAIASTTYDVFTGQLSVQLDQRSINSRENERMTEIRVQQRMVEPGSAHSFLTGDVLEFDTSIDLTINNETQLIEEPIEFTLTRAATLQVRIVLDIEDTGASVNDSRWQIGYTLDGETWDRSNPAMSSDDYLRDGINGGTAILAGNPGPRKVATGKHFMVIWARDDAGSYTVNRVRVFRHG
jgi:hypothetical protein